MNTEDHSIVKNSRYDWVDAMKFLAVFAVYLGHFDNQGAYLQKYVYTFHLPLFFFTAGFFAIPKKEITIFEFVKKKINTIVIPYLIFSAINIFVRVVDRNYSIRTAKDILIPSLLGIKAKTAASALWFLPCIFVISIVYFLLFKLFKNKYVVFGICCGFFIAYCVWVSSWPNTIWGTNVAFWYIFYYALGSLAFPFIRDFNFSKKRFSAKLIYFILLLFVIVLSIAIFFLKDFRLKFPGALSRLSHINSILPAIVGIILSTVLAFSLSKFNFVRKAGKDSLFYCGTEEILILIFKCLIGFAGVELSHYSPFSTIVFTMILLCMGQLLFPILKKAIPKL